MELMLVITWQSASCHVACNNNNNVEIFLLIYLQIKEAGSLENAKNGMRQGSACGYAHNFKNEIALLVSLNARLIRLFNAN